MNNKGVSQVVSVVLIVVMTLTLVFYFYTGLSRITDSANRLASNATENVFNQIGTSIKIDSATRTAVYVRNDGSSEISNYTLALYVDRSQITFTMPVNLAPGSVGSMAISAIPRGYHEFKVTAANSAAHAYIYVE